MLAIVCPGQGSQKPGFLAPWLELPGIEDRLAWLSAAAGIDLVAHGTTSDEQTIKDTAVAQPLIVGAGLVALEALTREKADAWQCVGLSAGHSVGEITTAAATGVLGAEAAMVFVRERGRAMAQASAVQPTGMSAVLGGKEDEVAALIAELGLTPANVNGGGQLVAAGTMDQLAALAENPPARARVIPLSVAGAFHTQHMASAHGILQRYASVMTTHQARVPVLTNRDGTVLTDGAEVLSNIVAQVTRPVRWDLCMEQMLAMGVTGIIELPPAGALTGLAKRVMKGVERLALNTPDDLPEAVRMLTEHAAPATADN